MSTLPPAPAADATTTPLMRQYAAAKQQNPTPGYAIPLLERQMGSNGLDGFGLARAPTAAIAAGAVVHYARSPQQIELRHVNHIRYYERSENLKLDAVTVRNLELIDPLFSLGASEATLYANLDCLMTPMGKRLLRGSLVRPLMDRLEIESRLEAVAVATNALIDREHLRKTLAAIQDMERMLSRIALDRDAEACRVHRGLTSMCSHTIAPS